MASFLFAHNDEVSPAQNHVNRPYSLCLVPSCELAFLHKVGIFEIEALFGAALWQPYGSYDATIGQYRLPLMLMFHYGALKAWLYGPLFEVVDPSLVALRLPAALLGALTVWLTFKFVEDAAGRLPALISSILLAADPLFILTTTLDWGAGTFQHIFFVLGLSLILRFCRVGHPLSVFFAFFSFGLGLWDKVLFAWNLVGAALAVAVTYPRVLLEKVRLRLLAVAAVGLFVGAAPLIVYNVDHPFATFQGNVRYSTESIETKLRVMYHTLAGSGLFGWLTSIDPPPRTGVPTNAVDRASVWLANWTNFPTRTIMPIVLLGSLLASYVSRKTPSGRFLQFLFITMSASWLQMAFNAGTGGAVHHAILLWPLPHIAVGIMLGLLAESHHRKYSVAALMTSVVLLVSGLLVTNTYYAQLVRNGPTVQWTESSRDLTEILIAAKPSTIFVADWGVFEILRFFSEGALEISPADDSAPDSVLARRLQTPNALFVGHTPEFTFRPAPRERLDVVAHKLQLRREIVHVLSDKFGRKIFEVYRFRPAASVSPIRSTPQR